jgi:hypothetical protein
MVISPGYQLVAQKLAEAATAMSHSDIRTRLQDSLSDAFRTSGLYGNSYTYAWIVDIFGDDKAGDVVYSYNDELKKASYTISGASCKIDTAAAVDVSPLTTYEVQGAEPLTEAGARNSKRDMAQIQAIHDGASKLGANCKMAEAARTEAGGLRLVESAEPLETIRLVEAKSDYEIKLIAPGKGSSAFYPAEVLKRDGPNVFKAGTRVYLNHATMAEEAARPEGDVRNLAGVTSTDAVYYESHAKGPGLYARMKVFGDHAAMVEEKAAHVGMSIRAAGIAESGSVKREGVPVLKSFTRAESVDIVTQAGAGGLILTESQRNEPQPSAAAVLPTNSAQEQSSMTDQEKTQLREATATNALLLKRAIKGDARELAATVLKDITLAEAAKARVIETCLLAVPEKDGDLDRATFTESVKAEAKREGAYLASFSGSGRVTGMGSGMNGVELTEAQRTEADAAAKRSEADGIRLFESFGLNKDAAAAAAKGRAA